jgi:glycerate kinase
MTRPEAHRSVLVAPDSFKGTITARAVAGAVARGLLAGGLQAEECPVADGGEGTMEVLLAALGGECRETISSDPIGRPVSAKWARLRDGRTAIVESAQASGLTLLQPDELDAERASSAGTGELLLAAARSGAPQILLAVGGTASTDGGEGALKAIGAGGGLQQARLTVLCDVQIPFEAAAPIFAPQKGADALAVQRLSDRLDGLASRWARDPRGVPMTGAGGGLAGGLWSCLGAELRPGAEWVLDAIHFERRLARARAVVVGEGHLDAQSLDGKIVGAIAGRAAAHQVPVHAIVGRTSLTDEQRERLHLRSVREAGTIALLDSAGRDLAEQLRGEE